MANFTVYFKDSIIQTHTFDSGMIRIGRDQTNNLIVDNLAVAPAHAMVVIKEDNCIIKQLDDDYPLVINDEKNKETLLQNNDKIMLGKHTVVFNISDTKNDDEINKKMEFPVNNRAKEEKKVIPEANLQVLSGHHIGRVLPLKKSMTRLGHSGSGIAIISKRKDGYFISLLESNGNIQVNQKNLGDKMVNLNNNDIVVIDGVSMQFFLEN